MVCSPGNASSVVGNFRRLAAASGLFSSQTLPKSRICQNRHIVNWPSAQPELVTATGVSLFALVGLFGLEMYPNLVFGNPGAANSLPFGNAASSRKTLAILLTIAMIGTPIGLAFIVSIKNLRKSQLWSEDFTAKLFCNVEFWLERLPKLMDS
jgi:hypothetical protein